MYALKKPGATVCFVGFCVLFAAACARSLIASVGGEEDPSDVVVSDSVDAVAFTPVRDVPVGEACTSDADCGGEGQGTCLADPDWPQGYCSALGCTRSNDCGSGAQCLLLSDAEGMCVFSCSAASDCREGYDCLGEREGERACLPRDPFASNDADILPNYPFPVTCSTEKSIPFRVPDSASSYHIVPFVLDDSRLVPVSITTPSDTRISFLDGPNFFQSTPASIFRTINPITIPPVPQLASQLESGSHVLEVSTSAERVCHYVVSESQPNDFLVVNFYGVGDADEFRRSDGALQDTFADVMLIARNIFSREGIRMEVGTVKVLDEAEDRASFEILRSRDDLENLMAQSEVPSASQREALSVNLFVIDGFAFAGEAGLLGISQGLPGAAGLHGHPTSGVTVTSEFVGKVVVLDTGTQISGNELTAATVAHEIGHFLGLFHTTEGDGTNFDPIEDTQECSAVDFPLDCPDRNNLMFPIAYGTNTSLSADQLFALGVHPLTRQE